MNNQRRNQRRNQLAGYIGTYTEPAFGGTGRGIYSFTLNLENFQVRDLRLCAGSVNPSYLCRAPSGKYLYAVNERDEFEGRTCGSVSAFAIEKGGLRLLNMAASEGTSPCHIVLDAGERFAVVSNYMSGTLAVFPLRTDGRLGAAAQRISFQGRGPVPGRQEASHAHSFFFDPGNTFGYACDLGADRIMAYSFRGDAPQPLSAAPVPPYAASGGAGPRHGVFHPSGKWCYVAQELDSTIAVLRRDPLTGGLERIAVCSTLPPGLSGEYANTAAAIRLAPGGTDTALLYVSNRGCDGISVFRVGPEGIPEFASQAASGGKTPRDFTLDPTGSVLLAVNQNGNNLVVFRVDKAAASLSMIGAYEIPSAVSVIL